MLDSENELQSSAEVESGQDVLTEDPTNENQEEIQVIETEEIAVNAVSGGAITVGNITTWTANDILAASEGDQGLTLHGTGWKLNTDKFDTGAIVEGPNAKAEGAKPLTDNAAPEGKIPNSGSYVSFKAEKDGILTIYEKTGKGKKFFVVSVDGISEIKDNTLNASTYDVLSVNVKSGVTYYAYLQAASAQIWKITFEKTQKTEWSAENLLNNNSKDDDGLIVYGDNWTSDPGSFDNGSLKIEGPNAKASGKKHKQMVRKQKELFLMQVVI